MIVTAEFIVEVRRQWVLAYMSGFEPYCPLPNPWIPDYSYRYGVRS